MRHLDHPLHLFDDGHLDDLVDHLDLRHLDDLLDLLDHRNVDKLLHLLDLRHLNNPLHLLDDRNLDDLVDHLDFRHLNNLLHLPLHWYIDELLYPLDPRNHNGPLHGLDDLLDLLHDLCLGHLDDALLDDRPLPLDNLLDHAVLHHFDGPLRHFNHLLPDALHDLWNLDVAWHCEDLFHRPLDELLHIFDLRHLDDLLDDDHLGHLSYPLLDLRHVHILRHGYDLLDPAFP